MKVLFHLLDAGVGGGQLVAARIAEKLAQRGDEIGLVVPREGPAAGRFSELGADISFIDAGSLRSPGSASSLSRLLGRYDLLYSHTSSPGAIVGAAAARLARRKHVVHQHTFPYFSPSPAAGSVQRVLFRHLTRAATFIAVADHVREGLETLGIRLERIRVIPNGVPPAAAPSAHSDDQVMVGMLARLDPGKNLEVFVDAAMRASPLAPVRFLIGGVSGPFVDYERNLRVQAAAAGIEIVSDAAGDEFLRNADIVVIPSSYEGSPLVLLEAMALGRAVIASDIPGIREVVEPRGAGVLVPPADAPALAAAIEALVDDRERRTELGRRAREVVSDQYRLSTMLDRTVDALDEVAGAKAAPTGIPRY